MAYDKNKPKVVVDTNIFINGWFSDNKSCVDILQLVDYQKVQLIFGQETIGELVYNIKNFSRHNINKVEDRIELLEYLMKIFYYSTSVNTMNMKEEDIPSIKDPYDIMFVKCAIKGNADYIITNDIKSGMLNMSDVSFKVMNSEDFIKSVKIS